MSENLEKYKHKTTKYDTDVLPRLNDIQDWITHGSSVRDVCDKLQISPDCWYKYCREHETLSELVRMSKAMLNNEVEKSLFKLCVGFEFEELKTVVEEDKNGKKHTRIEKSKKYQPPSPAAVSFFLRNRCPEDWSDKKQILLDTSQNELQRKQLFLQMLTEEKPIEVEGFEICEDEDKGNELEG